MKSLLTICLFQAVLVATSCTEEKHYTEALSPAQALERFQIHDGFKIELLAAEPHVMDPVSLVFDARGDMFVVEMPDYPYKPKPGEGRGRIKKLIDTDGDGQIDKSVVFADQLSEATSILPWQDGLLVTAAPNILYLQDTDGDSKADQEEILFSGFFDSNSEAQITNLRLSVDNWIYAANHGQAGEVNFTRMPDAPPLAMQGGDFRFRLDREAFELTTGPAQFGLTIDDWGHRFMTHNTIHIRQAVMPKRYTERQPNFSASTEALNISDHDLLMYQLTPPPYWRAERTKRRQQKYDEQGLDREEYADDHFSGAAGGTIYTGDAFPEEYYGSIFTGDVSGNLVHRDVIISANDSLTFVASREGSEPEKEFLASTDPWFRPTNFTVGPDGYLYVIDMYRQHIETPLAIPEDLKEDMDFMNGSERGRIYRIKPIGHAPTPKAVADLTTMEPQQIAGLLGHPNQWWRLQAQRLLLERADTSVIPTVETLFATHEDPRARLHALYVLEGLNQLNEDIVRQVMTDKHPGVREHGILLAERFPSMLPDMIACLKDSSARVAFQASLSLGEYQDKAVVPAMAEVVKQKGENPWFQMAILSSEPGSSFEMLTSLSEDPSFLADVMSWKLQFLEDISYAMGARSHQPEVASYLEWLENQQDDWQQAGVSGLVKGLKKSDNFVLKELEADEDRKAADAIAKLKSYIVKSI